MRISVATLAAGLLVFGLCAPATAQSPKVFDNDDLPNPDGVSVVGTGPAATANSARDATSNSGPKLAGSPKNEDIVGIQPGQSLQKRQQAYARWQERIIERRKGVYQLAAELEGLKRNAPMSVTALHLWPDDQMYMQLVIEKQKALDQAEENLTELQEQARRAGVPSSFRDGDLQKIGDETQQDRKAEYASAISSIQTRKAGLISTDAADSSAAGEKGSASNVLTDEMQIKEKKDAGEIKPGQSPEERHKAFEVWKKGIQQRKSEVDQLTRDLDNLKTNIPTAVILHLWPDDQMYQQLVAEKQKALDEAQVALSDYQEEAQKAGVPSSFAY